MNRTAVIRNSEAEERYEYFLSSAVENREVCLIENDEGYAAYEQDGYINLIVYPQKEDARYFAGEDSPVMLEVYDFLELCKESIADETLRIAVYPNNENAYLVNIGKMVLDLTRKLEPDKMNKK